MTNFLAPLAFLLAVLLPVIVLMYLLKLRRIEREVSSVYLWRRMIRDVEANAPWQRLRRNLLMILQLLFLVFLIFALARPFTWTQGAAGQAAIILLDVSASMGATDVAPNRLEAAKGQARQMVDSLPADTRLTVIAAGSQAQVLLASSQDRRQAHLALEQARLTAGGSNLGVALELASAIAARQPDTEIIVLSDGRVTLPELIAPKGNVRYYPIGLRGENQAISLLTLEPAPGGESLTAFAQVSNYGESAAARRLTLHADGLLVQAFDLEIPPGGQQAVLAEGLPPETLVLEAQLGGQDDLPTDDRALAVPPVGEPAAITLVSQGNRFLETALALLPGVELTQVVPEEAELPAAALTIFDNFVPLTATLPAGNLLFIAPPRSSGYFSITGVMENPALRAADPTDPLLAHISLAEVNVLDAARIPLPDWAHAVVNGESDGENSPLLFTGEVDGRRVAVLAFDLRRSDLPLQVAFPLLWANLTGWLAPGSQADIPPLVSPGEVVSFPVPPDVESVIATRPDGSTTRLPVQRQEATAEAGRLVGQVTFAETGELGVYRLRWGEGEQASFVVNLFAPQESHIQPVATSPFPEGAGGGSEETAQMARREWWRPLALLSLAVLTAEWLVYQRSALARLRTHLLAAVRGRKPTEVERRG